MPSFRYLQLDVFPAALGGGNPLGVVLAATGLTEAQMQRIARWTNLVETTFVLPAEDAKASYRLRIFTPHSEIPFAGHPTVGSAHAVLETGFAAATDARLVQQCGAGLLPIRIEGEGGARVIFVQAPAARILREGVEDGSLRAALGFSELGKLPPAFVEGGRRWWVAELADEASVRSLQPNHTAIKALARADACLGLCVFARC
jgi:PhzF family phenazine biosynthesis protein